MDKLESHAAKEAAWRSRLQRHAQSGKSIAAFCRVEAVSTASFHIWRASNRRIAKKNSPDCSANVVCSPSASEKPVIRGPL